MKKILSIIVIAATFTACGGGQQDEVNSSHNTDTTMNVTPIQTGDTSNLQNVMGDSTTTSGSHGQGSGSRVGGGVTGGAQGRTSDSSKNR